MERLLHSRIKAAKNTLGKGIANGRKTAQLPFTD